MNTSLQAAGRLNWPRFDSYPFRVIVRGRSGEQWTVLEIFEWSNEEGAHRVGLETMADYPALDEVHYYVGEVA
ncbi:hypothetical protein ABIB86_000397 [Bradyrhizobium sp. JR1.7]|uniref:hypothetical protein n=1 Tax=unclassified Bradyrhizobium TaxID=2631580 RepID=UPI0033991AEB